MKSVTINKGGIIIGAGQYSNVIGGVWQGANGKWYSLGWQGNQWTGSRASAISRASALKIASRGIFVIGAGISVYQGIVAYQNEDYQSVLKSGLDVAMGAVATFGGPAGLVVGGGYFALDAIGAFDKPLIVSGPNFGYYFPVQDNTRVHFEY